MTEAGNKQGYTGVERKKESSVERGDESDKGEKEIEDRDDIFGRIKQVDLHAKRVGLEDAVFIEICRRW